MRLKGRWVLPSAMLVLAAGCYKTTMTGPGYSAISAKDELVRTANDAGVLLEQRTQEVSRIESEMEYLDEKIADLERRLPVASEQDKVKFKQQLEEMRDRKELLAKRYEGLRERQEEVLVQARERFEAARDEMRKLYEDLDAQLR
ncbi:MAG: hypothetical protein ACYTKD_24620 [Planctomycetota bacterium]|jgi:chromosome segregation ATPase